MYNPKHHRNRRLKKSAQMGFSLMELMVGITIGLLVVVAAMSSLVYTLASAGTMTDSTRLQQEADNTFRIIGFQIQQAGAVNLDASADDPSQVRFSNLYTGIDPSITLAAAGQILSVHGVEGSALPDTLRVSFQDIGGTSRDCLGNTLANNNTWNNALRGVRINNQFSVTAGELRCLGATSAAAQAIGTGIEDFQVVYGTQNSPGSFQYYTAATVPSWVNVQAVAICMQIAGTKKGNPQTGPKMTGCSGQDIANDGLLRKVVRRTFTVRNATL